MKAANESVLANVNLVGELARQYFGAYELVSFNHMKVMAAKTAEFLSMGVERFAEAAFLIDGPYYERHLLKPSIFDVHGLSQEKKLLHSKHTPNEAIAIGNGVV